MKDLEWKDEYAFGIPAIDFQHRRIFDCILGIAAGSSDADRILAEAEIIKLLGLLQEHFALEESMMRALHYPGLEQHIEEHLQFHADVHHLAQTSLSSTGGVSREAIKITHKWLKEHIMESDRHYLDFIERYSQEPRKKRIAK
jgi:hemerythrin-like metal-binding protein